MENEKDEYITALEVECSENYMIRVRNEKEIEILKNTINEYEKVILSFDKDYFNRRLYYKSLYVENTIKKIP